MIVYSFGDIYSAYIECRQNKRNSINALKFEINLIENLYKILESINSRRYNTSRYICFIAHSPKSREIFASDFRDRVVHHLLVRQIEPIFERYFIHDSYSCRKDKGIHKAVARLTKFVQNKEYKCYLQLDIKNFFLSINKNILSHKLLSKLQDYEFFDDVKFLIQKILFDNPTRNYIKKGNKKLFYQLPKHKSLFFANDGYGLPIGNLTSQFFANVYLSDFDNYIKRELKCKYYIRYVDDFIILGKDADNLNIIKFQIEKYLEEYLELNLRSSYRLRSVCSGIDFLGYIIRPKYRLVRRRVVNNFKHKRAIFLNKFKNGLISTKIADDFRQINASYYGHFKLANSHKLINKYQMKNWIKKENKNHDKKNNHSSFVYNDTILCR
jgi:hypothetical protein